MSTGRPPVVGPAASRSGPEKDRGVADLLECPICYLQFERPLQLSCGHTFCASCVDRLVENARPAANDLRPRYPFPLPPPPLPQPRNLDPEMRERMRMIRDREQREMFHQYEIYRNQQQNEDRLNEALRNARLAADNVNADLDAARDVAGDNEPVPPDAPGDGIPGAIVAPPGIGLGGLHDMVNEARRNAPRARDRMQLFLERERARRREREREDQAAGARRPRADGWEPPPFGIGRGPEDPFDRLMHMRDDDHEPYWRMREREREIMRGGRERAGGAGGTSIRCPECRKTTNVPQDGLPVNYRLQDMINRIVAAGGDVKPQKDDPVNDMKCLECHSVLVGGVYFSCTSCMGHTSSRICPMCAIRLHNGHGIEEKKALTEQDLAEAKENINLQTARATQVLDQLQEKLQQLSKDASEGIGKFLVDSMDVFGHLAGGMDTVIGNTLEGLDQQRNKAVALADKYEELLVRCDALLESNRAKCTELLDDFRAHLTAADLSGTGTAAAGTRRVKTEPEEDMEDVVFIPLPAMEPLAGLEARDVAGPSGLVPEPLSPDSFFGRPRARSSQARRKNARAATRSRVSARRAEARNSSLALVEALALGRDGSTARHDAADDAANDGNEGQEGSGGGSPPVKRSIASRLRSRQVRGNVLPKEKGPSGAQQKKCAVQSGTGDADQRVDDALVAPVREQAERLIISPRRGRTTNPPKYKYKPPPLPRGIRLPTARPDNGSTPPVPASPTEPGPSASGGGAAATSPPTPQAEPHSDSD